MVQYTLEQILQRNYGCDVLNAPPEAILWAAESFPDREAGRSALQEANNRRARLGKTCAYPAYGSPLF